MTAVLPTPRRSLVELDERRVRMLSSAEGRVLDVVAQRSRLRELAEAGERFDTVVSVLQISTATDAAAMCRTLKALLADDGELWFLEPTSVAGAAGAVQHAFGRLTLRTTGRRPDLDIPRLLRESGLTVTDCERFTVRALWPFRSFVQGVARHPVARVAP